MQHAKQEYDLDLVGDRELHCQDRKELLVELGVDVQGPGQQPAKVDVFLHRVDPDHGGAAVREVEARESLCTANVKDFRIVRDVLLDYLTAV